MIEALKSTLQKQHSMEYVIMIGQFLLSLSILIILHELGHFLAARAFKTRVEKFYLFFNPWFSLFKFKKGDTEYGIGWLPLGGYVKISGMVDESFDKEQLKKPPQPWEFRSKPAWQRLIIMIGGVTVNFFLGLFIYAMLLYAYGEEYLPAREAVYGIHVDSLGMAMGLQNGDKILQIGDQAFDKFNSRTLVREVVINNADKIVIERNGQRQTLSLAPAFVGKLASHKNKNAVIFEPRIPFVAAKVIKDSPAEKAGLQAEDSLIAVNGTPLRFFDQFVDSISSRPGQEVLLTVVREGQTKNLHVRIGEDGKIGVVPYGPARYFRLEKKRYSLAEAIPAGARKGIEFLTDQIKAFGQIITNKIPAKESLGGFASIGSMFGTQWNWQRFWSMTAALSLILAFMNLLPIPALDGGYVMFLLYEVITGKKPSDDFMEKATMIGFILILALLIYANGLDIMRGCQ